MSRGTGRYWFLFGAWAMGGLWRLSHGAGEFASIVVSMILAALILRLWYLDWKRARARRRFHEQLRERLRDDKELL